MLRIVLGSYLIRYPLGGMMSWVLQYLAGFRALGHDVCFVEKAGYANACYDPTTDTMGDDPSCGIAATCDLLARIGMERHWCFVDHQGRYHGLSRPEVEQALSRADLFVDMGTHGSWLPEAAGAGRRVMIDGEPGFTQMKMQLRRARGLEPPVYDAYYTTGLNIADGTAASPDAGIQWRPILHPVDTQLVQEAPLPAEDAPFTTVMNWQSYEPLVYDGVTYGHKDMEFARFMDLPGRTGVPLEAAVSGRNIPHQRLMSQGWRVRDAHDVSRSYEAFMAYIRASRGEFGVCKNGYIATRGGWFSDRSATYLAQGRPVVMQNTGFDRHLPCGEGLFAVATPDEAASAIAAIVADYPRHSRTARAIACEYLDARKVLRRFLADALA